MNIEATRLRDVLHIQPRVFGDERGFFMESWNERVFAEAGLDLRFVQDNHSRSSRGILRGLHYQTECVQGKLVRQQQYPDLNAGPVRLSLETSNLGEGMYFLDVQLNGRRVHRKLTLIK